MNKKNRPLMVKIRTLECPFKNHKFTVSVFIFFITLTLIATTIIFRNAYSESSITIKETKYRDLIEKNEVKHQKSINLAEVDSLQEKSKLEQTKINENLLLNKDINDKTPQ